MATASSPYSVVQWSLTGKPCFLVVRTTKNRPKLLLVVREIVRPRRSCRSGRSPEACSRSAARSRSANCWVTTAHNGRRCSRRRCSRRVLSGQSDMKGCRPARVGSKTTPWRSIGCIDPRGSPAGGAASAPRGIFLRRSTCKRTETQPGRPPEEKPKAPERGTSWPNDIAHNQPRTCSVRP